MAMCGESATDTRGEAELLKSCVLRCWKRRDEVEFEFGLCDEMLMWSGFSEVGEEGVEMVDGWM